MPVSALLAAAALAAPAAGPDDAMRSFWTLVNTRPAEACRTYLTPRARKQWDGFGGFTCRQDRVHDATDFPREFRVVARPSRRVARVAMHVLDTPICGELEPETISTVVRRDGRWKIARFGDEIGCMQPW